MNRESVETGAFWGGYVLLLAFMLLPPILVVITSFSARSGAFSSLSFPPPGYSLTFYGEVFNSPSWVNAFKNSVLIALGTMVVSTIMGVTAALGLELSDDRRLKLLVPLVLVPLLVPPVVLGITLLVYAGNVGLRSTVNGRYLTVILAHSLWSTPLVFFIMQAVFSRFDWTLRDAGQDLGAGPFRVFFYVILPGVKEGILVAALIAFVVSLQEFIMALFLTGFDTRTIPVLAWSALRQTLSPAVSVVSTLLIAVSIVIVVVISLVMNVDWLAKRLS